MTRAERRALGVRDTHAEAVVGYLHQAEEPVRSDSTDGSFCRADAIRECSRRSTLSAAVTADEVLDWLVPVELGKELLVDGRFTEDLATIQCPRPQIADSR